MSGIIIVVLVLFIVVFVFWSVITSEPSKPEYVRDPYNLELSEDEKREEDYYDWLRYEATEEDLREIYGEPEPMTEEEKKRIEENSKHYSEEPDDDLPF